MSGDPCRGFHTTPPPPVRYSQPHTHNQIINSTTIANGLHEDLESQCVHRMIKATANGTSAGVVLDITEERLVLSPTFPALTVGGKRCRPDCMASPLHQFTSRDNFRFNDAGKPTKASTHVGCKRYGQVPTSDKNRWIEHT
eukprot:scaffold1410_cov154-Amphora_coffeaeformis.AAC.12